MRRNNRFGSSLSVLALLIALSMTAAGTIACGGDDDDDDSSGDDDMDDDMDDDAADDDAADDDADDDTGDDDATEEGSVRVIHLSYSTPAVDIYVNDSILAFENLDFKAGTAFAALPAGNYSFQVKLTGETDTALEVPSFDVAADTFYTVAAVETSAKSAQILPLVDDLTAPEAGKAHVRAIHASALVDSLTESVDIWLVPEMGDPTPLWEDVAFLDAGAYLPIDADTPITLGFDLDDDASPDVLFNVPGLAEGTVANVFAVSNETDTFLIAQFNDEPGSTVQIDPAI